MTRFGSLILYNVDKQLFLHHALHLLYHFLCFFLFLTLQNLLGLFVVLNILRFIFPRFQ
jgi:hypothetical protein